MEGREAEEQEEEGCGGGARWDVVEQHEKEEGQEEEIL